MHSGLDWKPTLASLAGLEGTCLELFFFPLRRLDVPASQPASWRALSACKKHTVCVAARELAGCRARRWPALHPQAHKEGTAMATA